MTDVVDTLPEPLLREDRRRDRSADRKDRVAEDRRRDREPRERRDEKVAFRDERDDRPPRRDQHERRTSAEDRLGPSNALERRDRERENKRRKSPSPPPFGHRDRERRFSPPLRRTPPYKRSRRDEEYDTGRKGTTPHGNLLSGGEDLGRATGFAGDRR